MNSSLASAIRRSRFLVIDDNAFHRGIMTEALRALDAGAIEPVASVTDALDRVRVTAPQVILYEWDLPLVDGIEFTRMVRHGNFPVKRDTPLIITTGRNTREDVEIARRAGVDEYLMKPFATQSLELRLREVFFNRRDFVNGASYVGPCRRRKFLMDYAGPKRRLFDDEATGAEGPEAQVRKALARSKVQEAQRLARALTPNDRQAIRVVYTISKDIDRLANEMGDELLSNCSKSLVEYIAGVGASARFDPKVVEAHLDAFNQLMSLSNVQEEMREKVSAALNALVKKKLAR